MAALFSDDFESGGITNWTGSATSGGDLTVATGAAALHGTYGLSIVENDTNWKYVFKDVSATARIRSRFYFDPNGVTGDNYEFVIILRVSEPGDDCFNVIYANRPDGGGWCIFCQEATDANDYSKQTGFYAITDAPHCIEVDWKASSGAGANDGFLELIIDGVSKETLTSIDSDTHAAGRINFGDTGNNFNGGTFYMDDFVSNNDGGAIGLYPSGPAKLKTWNGLATAKIKTVNGLPIANWKTINGLV